MNKIPQTLYRGIIIKIDQLEDVLLNQKDMIPPYPPKIDEQGRKIVNDGNEYGVYTSDNIHMVLDVYGNPRNHGTIINNELLIGARRQRLSLPAIGISYEIDTTNIPTVREPFISSSLTGHYNNGFHGKEWIADSIPQNNYKIIRIRIGSDLLNNEIDIPLNENINETLALINTIINQRLQGLKLLEIELNKMSQAERLNIDIQTMNIYQNIFSINGFAFKAGELPTDICETDFIMQQLYWQNPQEINLYSMRLLEQLKSSLKMKQSRGDDINIKLLIELELKTLKQKEHEFMQKQLTKGITNPINLALEKKETTYKEMLHIIDSFNQQKQQNAKF